MIALWDVLRAAGSVEAPRRLHRPPIINVLLALVCGVAIAALVWVRP